MIHNSVVRWGSEGWNIVILADSPELCIDSLGAALTSSVYNPSKLGCFGTASASHTMNYRFLHFLSGPHSLHFKLCHVISALCGCQTLTFHIWWKRNGNQVATAPPPKLKLLLAWGEITSDVICRGYSRARRNCLQFSFQKFYISSSLLKKKTKKPEVNL